MKVYFSYIRTKDDRNFPLVYFKHCYHVFIINKQQEKRKRHVFKQVNIEILSHGFSVVASVNFSRTLLKADIAEMCFTSHENMLLIDYTNSENFTVLCQCVDIWLEL